MLLSFIERQGIGKRERGFSRFRAASLPISCSDDSIQRQRRETGGMQSLSVDRLEAVLERFISSEVVTLSGVRDQGE
jgi:hypothetical protein